MGNAMRMAGSKVELLGEGLLRYGLAGVIGSVGAMKFTDYEAGQIEPLVKNSPLFAWLYRAVGLRSTSRAIGVAELAIAGLLLTRAKWPRISAIGSMLATGMFASTLSFLFSTPNTITKSKRGIPILSGNPGQFLAKDVLLLAAAVYTLGEALTASSSSSRR